MGNDAQDKSIIEQVPGAIESVPMRRMPETAIPAVPMPTFPDGAAPDFLHGLKGQLPELFGTPQLKELDPKLIPVPLDSGDTLLHDATKFAECLLKGDVTATLMERAGDTFTGYNPLQTSRAASAFRDHAVDVCIDELNGPQAELPIIIMPDQYRNFP